MSALLRRFLDRTIRKVNRVAEGTPVPAGVDPREHTGPTARERTVMRRRLRALRRRREALMRDNRTQEVEAVDAEERAIIEALDQRKTLDELLGSGVLSRCPNCGELVASREHYCTNCGAEQPPARQPAEPKPPTPPRAPVVTGASSAQAQTPPGH